MIKGLTRGDDDHVAANLELSKKKKRLEERERALQQGHDQVIQHQLEAEKEDVVLRADLRSMSDELEVPKLDSASVRTDLAKPSG
jgi:hypothetical protein